MPQVQQTAPHQTSRTLAGAASKIVAFRQHDSQAPAGARGGGGHHGGGMSYRGSGQDGVAMGAAQVLHLVPRQAARANAIVAGSPDLRGHGGLPRVEPSVRTCSCKTRATFFPPRPNRSRRAASNGADGGRRGRCRRRGPARDGDTEAFRFLVERHSRGVFRLAFRMTGNEHDAEDVVQETFLKAYRNRPRARALARLRHRCRWADTDLGGRRQARGQPPRPVFAGDGAGRRARQAE